MEIMQKDVSYGMAMDWIQEGHKAARAHWGGYWFLPTTDVSIIFEDENWKTYRMNRFIVACLKDNGGYVPATPYAEDIQAHDWVLFK